MGKGESSSLYFRLVSLSPLLLVFCFSAPRGYLGGSHSFFGLFTGELEACT